MSKHSGLTMASNVRKTAFHHPSHQTDKIRITSPLYATAAVQQDFHNPCRQDNPSKNFFLNCLIEMSQWYTTDDLLMHTSS